MSEITKKFSKEHGCLGKAGAQIEETENARTFTVSVSADTIYSILGVYLTGYSLIGDIVI